MKKKRIVLTAILLLLVAGLVAGKVLSAMINRDLQQLVLSPVPDVALDSIKDGVYTGTYSAFPVSAEVKVTVKSHSIETIELVKHNNGKGRAAEVIPGKVVEAQSLNVDDISGATYSSRVILNAIRDALIKGKS